MEKRYIVLLLLAVPSFILALAFPMPLAPPSGGGHPTHAPHPIFGPLAAVPIAPMDRALLIDVAPHPYAPQEFIPNSTSAHSTNGTNPIIITVVVEPAPEPKPTDPTPAPRRYPLLPWLVGRLGALVLAVLIHAVTFIVYFGMLFCAVCLCVVKDRAPTGGAEEKHPFPTASPPATPAKAKANRRLAFFSPPLGFTGFFAGIAQRLRHPSKPKPTGARPSTSRLSLSLRRRFRRSTSSVGVGMSFPEAVALAAATTPSSHNNDDDDKAAERARSESALPSRPAAVSLTLDSSATTALPKGGDSPKKIGIGMGSKVRAFFARPRRSAGAGACAGPVVPPKRRLSLPLPSLPRPRLSFLRKASA